LQGSSKLRNVLEYVESLNPQWVRRKVKELERYLHEDDEYDEE